PQVSPMAPKTSHANNPQPRKGMAREPSFPRPFSNPPPNNRLPRFLPNAPNPPRAAAPPAAPAAPAAPLPNNLPNVPPPKPASNLLPKNPPTKPVKPAPAIIPAH